MQERLEKVEQALAELQRENSVLRAELEALKAVLPTSAPAIAPVAQPPADQTDEPDRPRSRSKYAVLIPVASLVLVTVLAFTVGHINEFWSGVLAALNGLVLYLVGPTVIRLLIEGAIRAIPTVVLGHTARVTWYKMRSKKGRQP